MTTTTFALPTEFTKSFTVAKSDADNAPSVTITATFKLAENLTVYAILAKMVRPEVIKAQAKIRKNWNKDNVTPALTMTCTIDNDERTVDPDKDIKKVVAAMLGIAPENVTAEQIAFVKSQQALLAAMTAPKN